VRVAAVAALAVAGAAEASAVVAVVAAAVGLAAGEESQALLDPLLGHREAADMLHT
jgi:hypothetical protein